MSSEYKYMEALIADGPRVLAHPAQVSRSRVATLSCSVDSNPPSKVVWYRQAVWQSSTLSTMDTVTL